MDLTANQKKILAYLKKDIKNISKESFIKFFFPTSFIYSDYLPSFYDTKTPIFLVDPNKEKGKKTLMDMIPNLVVMFKSTRNTIDSKKGFLTILTDVLGMKISEKLLKELNGFEDDDYWLTLKTWYTLGEVLEFEVSEQSSSTFNLFKSLFVGEFGTLYSLYKESGEPHQKVFSSLLTMMTKAKDLENQTNISPYYRKILESHSNYVSVFKKAVYNYSQTPVTEMDFINLLYECSRTYLQHRRVV